MRDKKKKQLWVSFKLIATSYIDNKNKKPNYKTTLWNWDVTYAAKKQFKHSKRRTKTTIDLMWQNFYKRFFFHLVCEFNFLP